MSTIFNVTKACFRIYWVVTKTFIRCWLRVEKLVG